MPLNTTLPSVSQAQSLLTPTQSDQSVGILNHLFGIPNGNWHSLYYQTIGGVGNGSLFFTLLKDFDLVVLAFVVITVFITMAIGVTSTAHEGKAFGNRYHALWTPLRSAFAMVLLAPIPGIGLSLIQGIVLLMIWFSIGGANYLATQATTYMAQNGGQRTSIAPGGGRVLANDVLQSELAMQFFINYEGAKINPTYTVSPWRPDQLASTGAFNPNASSDSLGPVASQGGPGHYTITFNTSGVKTTGGYLWGLIDANGVTPGQFGKFTITCTSQNSPMCAAQISAIEQMIATEAPYVQSLVNSSQAAAGSSSTSATNKAATNGPTLTNPTVLKAAAAYDAAVANAEQQTIAQMHPELMQAMDNINSNVTHLGWWTLGMYYWDIAHVNAGIQAQIGQPPVWSGYNAKAINKAMSSASDRKTFGEIEKAAKAGLDAASSASGIGNYKNLLTEIFSSEGAWYVDMSPWNLMGAFGGKAVANPLARLQMAGDLIMTTEVPAAIGAYTILRSVASAGKDGAEASDVPVLSGVAGAVAGAVSGATKAIGPYVAALVVAIFVVGAIWAYYLPSVPFIIWTMGLLGWLIFLIEALVGAVVWAAGIALPEGEGLFGPRGDQGVMLFLNIMFRPALMVIGFFASFMLIGIVGPIIGGSFGVFMGGMYSITGSGVTSSSPMSTVMALNPITWVASSVVLTIIMLTVTHKIFGLVTWIPENVFRWVGGQGVQLGEGGDEQRARGHVDAVGGFVNKGAGPKAKGADGAGEGAGSGSAGGGGEEVGGEKVGGNDIAGGGETVAEAPPTKPE